MGVSVDAGPDEPREVTRAAERAGRVVVGAEVKRLGSPVFTVTQPAAAPVVHARLAAGIRVEEAELTPGLAAKLRHAAPMRNPLFYERQRLRASTWGVPRLLYSFDETIGGSLILPRSSIGTVTALAEEAGSRLEVTDERSAGTKQVHFHSDIDVGAFLLAVGVGNHERRIRDGRVPWASCTMTGHCGCTIWGLPDRPAALTANGAYFTRAT